jgi:hypothetical protein
VSSDGTGIAVGNKWLDTVVERLRNADMYVVLCSQNSVDRPWINIELGAALSREKPIIPVCHTDLSADKLFRRPLSDYEAFNASDPEGLKGLFRVFKEALGSWMPTSEFEKIAEDIRNFEKRYLAEKQTITESIRNVDPPQALQRVLQRPRILCVSSNQFQETIREDLQLILSAFPNETHHRLIMTSAELGPLLVKDHFDIIHVAAYICPITGDLVFSPVDPQTKRYLPGERDCMPAKTFASLVKESGAFLAVLANNEALALVTKLLPVTNVVFALEPVESKMLAKWIESFYALLSAGHSVVESCRKAFAQHQIPMMMYPQLGGNLTDVPAWQSSAATTVAL